MDRRDFLRNGTAASALLAASRDLLGDNAPAKRNPIPKRPLGATGEQLSILAFSGTALMSIEQQAANDLVAEAFDRGVNFFDVSPSYGNAQERMGPALEPYRKLCFLSSKTDFRDKAGVEADIDATLKVLRTDHLDFYQHHLGFSAHSVETAIGAMDRAPFDAFLFPVNYLLFSKANFGPQVLEHAQKKGVARFAIKAMARGKYAPGLPESERTPKCWYEPCALPEESALAWRWTLSQPVTAALPPGNPAWFRLALDLAQSFQPITDEETKRLLAYAGAADPLFELGNNI